MIIFGLNKSTYDLDFDFFLESVLPNKLIRLLDDKKFYEQLTLLDNRLKYWFANHDKLMVDAMLMAVAANDGRSYSERVEGCQKVLEELKKQYQSYLDGFQSDSCDCGWDNAHNGETLDEHNFNEHDNQPYDILDESTRKCPDCGRICKSVAGLTKHMNDTHLTLSPSQLKQKAKYEQREKK